jgi:DNA replication protein DnaC
VKDQQLIAADLARTARSGRTGSTSRRSLGAILDRLVHNSHRIDLSGESLRRKHPNKA